MRQNFADNPRVAYHGRTLNRAASTPNTFIVMRILPLYERPHSECSGPSVEEDEAVIGLQASLRSSASLRAILECAKGRRQSRNIDGEQMKLIERICRNYEDHQKSVRDHCLDYFNTEPLSRTSPVLHERTRELVSKGKTLFSELREAILTF